MKCSKCYINYDDSEKECPFCGAKAGYKKIIIPQNTAGQRNRAYTLPTDTAKRPNINIKPTSQTAYTKPETPKKKVKGIGIIIVLLAILMECAPAVFNMVREAVPTWLSSDTGEYEEGYEEEYIYAYEFMGTECIGLLMNGDVATFHFFEDEKYLIDYVFVGGTTYFETGETYSTYIFPQEWMYETEFSPDEYDWYYLSFWQEENSISQGEALEEYNKIEDYAQNKQDLSVNVYVNRNTGEILFEKWQEGFSIFFDESERINLIPYARDTIT